MTGIDYFAWLVFIVIILAAVYVFVALAQLPGKTAGKRGHPQADAINVAGWVGIFTGAAWVVAIVWAFMKPVARPYPEDAPAEETPTHETTALKARVAELEARRGKRSPALLHATDVASRGHDQPIAKDAEQLLDSLRRPESR